MNSILKLSIILFFGIFICFSPVAKGQSTNDFDDSNSYYNDLLYALFPQEFDKPGRSFVLVIRYKPSFDAESQIVISGREDAANVVELTSADGNIYYKLLDIWEKSNDEPPASELAKQFRVKRRELRLPLSKLNNWRSRLLKSVSKALIPKVQESTLPKSKNSSSTDDGISYEVWDVSSSGELYFSPSGTEEGGKDFSGKREFERILEEIKREVAKYK